MSQLTTFDSVVGSQIVASRVAVFPSRGLSPSFSALLKPDTRSEHVGCKTELLHLDVRNLNVLLGGVRCGCIAQVSTSTLVSCCHQICIHDHGFLRFCSPTNTKCEVILTLEARPGLTLMENIK